MAPLTPAWPCMRMSIKSSWRDRGERHLASWLVAFHPEVSGVPTVMGCILTFVLFSVPLFWAPFWHSRINLGTWPRSVFWWPFSHIKAHLRKAWRARRILKENNMVGSKTHKQTKFHRFSPIFTFGCKKRCVPSMRNACPSDEIWWNHCLYMRIKTYQNLASGQVRRSSKVDLEVKKALFWSGINCIPMLPYKWNMPSLLDCNGEETLQAHLQVLFACGFSLHMNFSSLCNDRCLVLFVIICVRFGYANTFILYWYVDGKCCLRSARMKLKRCPAASKACCVPNPLFCDDHILPHWTYTCT